MANDNVFNLPEEMLDLISNKITSWMKTNLTSESAKQAEIARLVDLRTKFSKLLVQYKNTIIPLFNGKAESVYCPYYYSTVAPQGIGGGVYLQKIKGTNYPHGLTGANANTLNSINNSLIELLSDFSSSVTDKYFNTQDIDNLENIQLNLDFVIVDINGVVTYKQLNQIGNPAELSDIYLYYLIGSLYWDFFGSNNPTQDQINIGTGRAYVDKLETLTELGNIKNYNDLYRFNYIMRYCIIDAAIKKIENYDPQKQDWLQKPYNQLLPGSGGNFSTVVEEITFIDQAGINFDLIESLKRIYGSDIDNTTISALQSGFARVINPKQNLENLDEKYIQLIWNKLETSGLLELALHVENISKFAQTRFEAGTNLGNGKEGSALNALDPTRDTMWLNALSKAVTILSRDPITLALIQRYFPNIVTLFFNAIAVSADYSDGKADDPINSPDELAKSLLRAFGTDSKGNPVFTAAWDFIDTSRRIQEALGSFPFRENIPPNPPDIFHLRLGASNFYVPPISVNINTQFKTGSLTGGAIRQKNSPKFNSGYKDTSISIRLFFPNYEEIWGLSIDGTNAPINLGQDFKIDFKNGGDSEEKIDKFLSSLRGLVAAFKYSPILPIKNHYINAIHGITAVALSAMSISTIPNYPFALVVDLELLNFNHKPFLPMLSDFNQAIHWGKYRQYMGKAAGSLHSYINESFLLELPEQTDPGYRQNEDAYQMGLDQNYPNDPDGVYANENLTVPGLNQDVIVYENDVLTTNVIREWQNGNNITLYIPAQTQTKIFTPDISSFRTDEERAIQDVGQSFWDSLLSNLGIDITQATSYHRDLNSIINTSVEGSIPPTTRRLVLESIDLLIAGKNQQGFNSKIYDFYATSFVLQNKTSLNQEKIDWIKQGPKTLNTSVTGALGRKKYSSWNP